MFVFCGFYRRFSVCIMQQPTHTTIKSLFLSFTVSRNNGVPPAPPSSLTLTSASKAIVTLHWPPSRVDGGSPVTTYRLHYHRQFGDWDRVDLSSNVSSYSLHGLKCGTVYQFFMEAINEFGVGDRTDTLTASTQGSPPIAPLSVSLALSSINSTSIDLDLGAWRSGGCDISSFVIEYRKINSGNYTQKSLPKLNFRINESVFY